LIGRQSHELLGILGAKHLNVLGHAVVPVAMPGGDPRELLVGGGSGHAGRPHSPAFVVRRHDVDIGHATGLDDLLFEHRHQRPAHRLSLDHHTVVSGHTAD